MKKLKHVDLYTDGACSGNPGPGGWGVVLIYKGKEKELSGYQENTTNNRMEIFAVISGLRALKERVNVTVYTDSAYVYNAFSDDWITAWQLNGWKNSKKKPVENMDLWQELLDLVACHEVDFVKVKGHADNAYNNRCDKLATGQISKNKKVEQVVEGSEE